MQEGVFVVLFRVVVKILCQSKKKLKRQNLRLVLNRTFNPSLYLNDQGDHVLISICCKILFMAFVRTDIAFSI